MSSQVAVIIYNLYQLYPNTTRKYYIYIYMYIYNYIMPSIYDTGIMNESIVDLKKLKL